MFQLTICRHWFMILNNLLLIRWHYLKSLCAIFHLLLQIVGETWFHTEQAWRRKKSVLISALYWTICSTASSNDIKLMNSPFVFPQAYYREGVALQALKRDADALASFASGLAEDPKSSQLLQGLVDAALKSPLKGTQDGIKFCTQGSFCECPQPMRDDGTINIGSDDGSCRLFGAKPLS